MNEYLGRLLHPVFPYELITGHSFPLPLSAVTIRCLPMHIRHREWAIQAESISLDTFSFAPREPRYFYLLPRSGSMGPDARPRLETAGRRSV